MSAVIVEISLGLNTCVSSADRSDVDRCKVVESGSAWVVDSCRSRIIDVDLPCGIVESGVVLNPVDPSTCGKAYVDGGLVVKSAIAKVGDPVDGRTVYVYLPAGVVMENAGIFDACHSRTYSGAKGDGSLVGKGAVDRIVDGSAVDLDLTTRIVVKSGIVVKAIRPHGGYTPNRDHGLVGKNSTIVQRLTGRPVDLDLAAGIVIKSGAIKNTSCTHGSRTPDIDSCLIRERAAAVIGQPGQGSAVDADLAACVIVKRSKVVDAVLTCTNRGADEQGGLVRKNAAGIVPNPGSCRLIDPDCSTGVIECSLVADAETDGSVDGDRSGIAHRT